MVTGRGFGGALVSEFFGTGILTAVGVGLTVSATLTGTPASTAFHANAPALVVMALIYALGEASGAHFNPAVTLAFAVRGDFPWTSVGPYALAQILGSLCATELVLRVLRATPTALHEALSGTMTIRFSVELLLTTVLVFVIIATANRARIVGHNAAIAVAGAIAFDGLVGVPITGAAMNPGRSFGPIALSGAWDQGIVYFLAPTLGALVAVFAMWLIYGPSEHSDKASAEGN